MTIESREVYTKLLVPGLKEVSERSFTEEHERFDAMSAFYRVIQSESAFEEFYGVNGIGDIPKFNGKLEALVGSPGYLTRIEPVEFAAMRQWDRKFLDDKKYMVMKDDSSELGIAAARTRNKYCAYPFIYATSNNLEFLSYNEEGVSLVSSAHLTKSGASTSSGFTNTTTLALTPTNLEIVRLIGANIKSPLGTRMNTNFDTLIVPNALAKTAFEITQSDKDPYSGNNAKNYWNGKYKVIPWNLLDDYSTKDWYLVDSAQMKKDLLFINRFNPEFKSNWDFQTMITALSIYMRFGLGYKGWRWIIKSTVA
jgi:hypothetical protein